MADEYMYDACRRLGDMYDALAAGKRNIHIGVDIGAPVGTEVLAFTDGTIHSFGYLPGDHDYGNVVVTQHDIKASKTAPLVRVWALHGHLDKETLKGKEVGQRVQKGQVVGRMGPKDENGGWFPHVHFQLGLHEPTTHDMPGVCSDEDHAASLASFPDPRLVLGPVFPGEGLIQS